ncbi:MAG TPA: hypothetical protein VKB37_14660 [Jatrophihabitantaceae bacterium]|jgi:hypothetical protein|nr:hypothetical protein [Jatrophihabitantaceae bacterium]
MKRNHPPILWIAFLALLGMLAIGGGPVAFVLLVMASPSIAILAFMVRALFGGGSSRAVKHH